MFDKCQCAQAGWCELFKKEMTSDPPNWQWCGSLTEEERKAYWSKCNSQLRTIRRSVNKTLIDVINFYDKLPEPKSDYAVCVIAANDFALELLDITRENIVNYAGLCGADYIELTGNQHESWPIANKFRLHQVVRVYKKTLYVDCDVLIKDGAPDIFKITPDDKISAYDEYEIFKNKFNTEWIKNQQEVILHRFCNQETKDRLLNNGKLELESMLNGGVLVIPQSLANYYKQPNEPYFKQWCFDQNYLTLSLPKEKLHNLSYVFNCEYEASDFYLKHKTAHFLHINNLKNNTEKRKNLLLKLKDSTDIIEQDMLIHEDFSMDTRYHKCHSALENQEKINIKIKEYVINQQKSKLSVDNVCILCLGHSAKQFNSIIDRPYLKKVNLNEIRAGKYSGNEWAESRAFLSEVNLFPEKAEFYGFVTASWNLKYHDHYKIDNFHNWFNTNILINSEPEDRVVLCADMFCWCGWINDSATTFRSSVLRNLLDNNQNSIGRQFFKLVKLDRKIHKRVPYSNQQIYHKSMYFEWRKFLETNDMVEKVKWFVDNVIGKNHFGLNENVQHYSNRRMYAYFMEMLNITWFTNNDFKIIANTTRKENWYNYQEMAKRSKIW